MKAKILMVALFIGLATVFAGCPGVDSPDECESTQTCGE